MAVIELPLIRIEVHEASVPWLKIFVRRTAREFSDCTPAEKQAVFVALDVIEAAMIDYYQPEKINIASFGNMLPQVHWHIMARFKNDTHFPEPMWGPKQRESDLTLPPLAPLMQRIETELAGKLRA